MKRFVVASAVLALTAAFPAGAGASTKWMCDVPGVGTVTFVSAADAARHGIETADSKAGVVSTCSSARSATSSDAVAGGAQH